MTGDARNSGLTPTAHLQDGRLLPPDRFWLLTWTSYGTWLPGDERGFVSNVDRGDGKGIRRNVRGTEPARRMRGLEVLAKKNMSGPLVLLASDHSTPLLDQFHETARCRSWELIAAAIMSNHVHIVVGVPGDPEPEAILGSFKSYGSRRLNRLFGSREGDTWWTAGGSKRCLKSKASVFAAVRYVRDQEHPLLVWTSERWRSAPACGGRQSPVSLRVRRIDP